jgi:hypothetical protein
VCIVPFSMPVNWLCVTSSGTAVCIVPFSVPVNWLCVTSSGTAVRIVLFSMPVNRLCDTQRQAGRQKAQLIEDKYFQ